MKILAAQRLLSTQISANVDIEELQKRIEDASGWRGYSHVERWGTGKIFFQGVNVPGKKFEVTVSTNGDIRAWSPAWHFSTSEKDVKRFFRKLSQEAIDRAMRKRNQAKTVKGARRADLLQDIRVLVELADQLLDISKNV